jgi:hypothetical protein
MEDKQMAKQISTGKCNLCGSTFNKQAMTNHIDSCKQKNPVSESSSGAGPRKTKTFYLIVEGQYSPEYWMHLEIPADATLEVLDGFLRQIWLECCGHLSAFTVEGKRYSVSPMDDFNDETMGIKLNEVLKPGMKFFHEYDFGSTTHLALKVISEQESRIKGKSVRVLARNDPPPILCNSCGKMATRVCTECICNGEGWLCDQCAAEHKCGEDMLLPVVNSPRVGTCGYTGD